VGSSPSSGTIGYDGCSDCHETAPGSSPLRIVTNSTYAEQWKKMRRIALRLALAAFIGPAGLILNHYFIDRSDRFTARVEIFWWAAILFFIWSLNQYKT
jgi:hypothetical protein